MELFTNEITRLLEKEGMSGINIEIPPNPLMGDFAVPCFLFSKTLRKAPNIIANEIALKLSDQNSNLFEKIVATGPYINFYANTSKIAERVLTDIQKNDEEYGKSNSGKNEKVMIEFSSPNTNKPLHLGHVRNILIGESISRILESTRHKVIRACLVNDRGVHICKSMIAYKNWGDNSNPDKKSDHYVGDWYVKFSNEAKNDPTLEDEAQKLLVKWEQKDPETIELWKKMNNWVYTGFDETYKKLHISFDKIFYESNLYDKGKEIAEIGFKEGKLRKDEKGNIVAPLSDYKFENDKVLLRADGTTVYITQDVYLAKLKFDEYSLNKSFYVVGSEQKLHFEQLFKLLEILNLAKTENLKHISYGMVYLPEGKMKSREGTVVDADDLIVEVKNLASEEIEKRYPTLSDEEKEKRVETIGVGALKFFMLKNDTSRDMIYDPKESVSFDGETGPYIQYAYARINSIFEKANITIVPQIHNYSIYDSKEKCLLIKLNDFKKAIEDAKTHLKPSFVAKYLIELAQLTNEYYHSHHVLTESDEIKNARLLLLDSIRIVIKNGLLLLGIDVVQRM